MISAIVLTHNNESSILPCLESLSWCDELIVVDDNSTDQTQRLVKKFGAQLFLRDLNDNFADQRNFALSKAKNEWVFYVDSDEIVTKNLAKEIQEAIGQKDIQGYFLKRQDVLFGSPLQYGETSQGKFLRLARKNAGLWQRSVHETWKIAGTVGELKHPLMHYPHQNLREFIEDINYYSTLHAQEFHKQGKQVSAWQIVIYPAAKFIQNYIFRQGFRDGTPGAILALMMSLHSFLAKGKLYVLTNKGESNL